MKSVLLFFLGSCIQLAAAEFYVDGTNGNDANSGAAASPWKTIAKANQTLSPGDTVQIKAGTYNQAIAPVRSGTSTARITFRNFGQDGVTISDTTRGINLIGRSYITVEGIHFYNLDTFLWIENSSRNQIGYCSFDKMRNSGQWSGSRIWINSQYNRVYNCVFSKFGYFTSSDDIGAILDIGNENVGNDLSHYNVIENSTMFHAGHHVLGINSMRNVIRNNYFHNENWSGGFGDRVLYLNGEPVSSGGNLIEGNRIAFAGNPPDQPVANGIQLSTRSNIVRLNAFYGSTAAGIGMSVTAAYSVSPEYNRIYNNTFYTNGWHPANGRENSCGLGLANYGGTFTLVGNAIKNNVFYQNPTSIGTYRVNLAEQIIAGNWEQTGDPRFVNPTIPADYSNASLPDLKLKSDSPCIDRGVFLATVSSASGSGRTFRVDDVTYFSDGWGIVEGDVIQLQNSSVRPRIVGIDNGAKTLTVDRDINWTQGQGVALQFEGSAPDIGAYESQPPNSPPVITSSSSASGMQGQPFNYQIAANNTPTSFGASGLPAGLAVATGTGIISGVPQSAGTFSSTISASNAYGSGTATLTISIGQPAPIIRVNPGSLTFPETGTGQSVDLQLYVTNSGAGTLTGTATANGPFTIVSGGNYSLTSGQVWPVTVRYSPSNVGTHNNTIAFTGGGGFVAQLNGSSFPMFSSWAFPSTGGLVVAPFAVSGGYVSQSALTTGDPTTSGAGRAVYGFMVTNTATVLVSASINAPDEGANSLYFNIDAEPTDPGMIWDIPVTSGFQQQSGAWRGTGDPAASEFVPKTFILSPGPHKLVFRGREPGVQIGGIEISLVSTRPSPPTNLRIVQTEP